MEKPPATGAEGGRHLLTALRHYAIAMGVAMTRITTIATAVAIAMAMGKAAAVASRDELA